MFYACSLDGRLCFVYTGFDLWLLDKSQMRKLPIAVEMLHEGNGEEENELHSR